MNREVSPHWVGWGLAAAQQEEFPERKALPGIELGARRPGGPLPRPSAPLPGPLGVGPRGVERGSCRSLLPIFNDPQNSLETPLENVSDLLTTFDTCHNQTLIIITHLFIHSSTV